MRILITNDDGVNAIGLKKLVKVAMKYGTCTVVAPKFEQSGKSHSIKIREDMEFKQVEDLFEGVKTYSVDCPPADCVRVGLSYLRLEPDLVLSGINPGFNTGEDIVYSGTCACVTEAAMQGIKALAFSTSFDTIDNIDNDIEKVMKYVMDNKLLDIWPVYNINVPVGYKDICFARQGKTFYDCKYQLKDNMLRSISRPFPNDDGIEYSDVTNTFNNMATINPLSYDRTNQEILKKLILNQKK